MNKRFIPYSQHVFGANEIQAVVDVLRDGWIARGQKVVEFEDTIKQKYGYLSATACSSGSSALEIVFRSLNLSHDDEVIVPTVTWAATASSIVMAGAKPVFCDIDPNTFNAEYHQIEKLITPNTRAIVVVHLTGRPCSMDAIWDLAEKHSLQVVEDSAHAFGSFYLDRTPISSSPRSYASIFSFHPAKNITTAEGGLIVTQHQSLDSTFKLLRAGGVQRINSTQFSKANYLVTEVSSNYHMTELQAVLGLEQLKSVDSFIARRRSISSLYFSHIKSSFVCLPEISEVSSWNLFVIQTLSHSFRENLFAHLQDHGIGCYFHYPPLHQFADIYGAQTNDFPCANEYSLRAITLPIGPHLHDDDVLRICSVINAFTPYSF